MDKKHECKAVMFVYMFQLSERFYKLAPLIMINILFSTGCPLPTKIRRNN